MSQKEWGNITWNLFHTLAEKVNENKFPFIKDQIIQFIRTTCRNLPCPTCSDHAIETLNQSNIELIKTKADLIEFLRQFHNIVNINTDKPVVEKIFVITHYKNGILINIIREFQRIYSHKYGNFDINSFNRANKRHMYLKNAIKSLNYILQFCD